MTEERVTPLRQRMIEDMRIRGMGDKAQKSHIRAIKDFAAFLGRSPDTATPEDLRAYQLHMSDTGVTPSTFNTRIVALRFFFGMTCGREESKAGPKMIRGIIFPPNALHAISYRTAQAACGFQFRRCVRHPDGRSRARPQVLRRAQHFYGTGLRVAEVCNLKVSDIDSDRMLIHVELGKGQKDRKVMLSPGLLELLRAWWREARPEAGDT